MVCILDFPCQGSLCIHRHADKKAFRVAGDQQLGQLCCQLRPVLSSLSVQTNHSKQAQHVSAHYPPHAPLPPKSPSSTSCSADVPSILKKPAYIPHMFQLLKEMLEQHMDVTHGHWPRLSLYRTSPCVPESTFIVLSHMCWGVRSITETTAWVWSGALG
ncbi:hypothetical protein ILYODFUR_028489 [Ilyodon furcidens]|uniref:Uncharacterized protein n=1 Tax=Ilyodon furcidens TaxID=33524 RepID=A0ABV0UW26_9TELE